MIFSNLLLATVAAAGIVHLPLRARNLAEAPELAAHLAKRSVDHAAQTMGSYFYQADLKLGTPAQDVTVCFDTGSALLWVPGANSTACEAGRCRPGHTKFNVSESTSWRYQSEGGAWGGNGISGKETVSYAGQTLENFNLWVSKDKMNNNFGIFGQAPNRDTSGSFVQGLAAAGKIPRAVYSLNAEAPIDSHRWDGNNFPHTVTNVYYGGFDEKKYEGPLTTVDLKSYGAYGMMITGMSSEGEPIKLLRDHAVVLDTGGLTLQLTNGTVGQLAAKNGGGWTDKGWHFDCNSQPEITFEFGYTHIPVNLTHFLKKESDHLCRLNAVSIVSDSQGTLLTGPPMISRALVIYDNDRQQITVGKARYTTESNVIELTGDIPGTINMKDFVPGQAPPVPASQSSAAPHSSSAAPVPHSSSAAPKPQPQSSTLAIQQKSSTVEPSPQSTASSGDQFTDPFGQFPDPFGSSDPFDQSSDSNDQFSDPFDQFTDPFDQQSAGSNSGASQSSQSDESQSSQSDESQSSQSDDSNSNVFCDFAGVFC